MLYTYFDYNYYIDYPIHQYSLIHIVLYLDDRSHNNSEDRSDCSLFHTFQRDILLYKSHLPVMLCMYTVKPVLCDIDTWSHKTGGHLIQVKLT